MARIMISWAKSMMSCYVQICDERSGPHAVNPSPSLAASFSLNSSRFFISAKVESFRDSLAVERAETVSTPRGKMHATTIASKSVAGGTPRAAVGTTHAAMSIHGGGSTRGAAAISPRRIRALAVALAPAATGREARQPLLQAPAEPCDAGRHRCDRARRL